MGLNLGWIDLICSRQDVDRCIANLIEDLLLRLAGRDGCRFVSETALASNQQFERNIGSH